MNQTVAYAVIAAIVLSVISLGAFALMLAGDWLGEDGQETAGYVAVGGTIAAMALAGMAGRRPVPAPAPKTESGE